ncbi:MAG: glycosyltransferase family 4 protein [Acidimicrobiales bacterium]|jgi:glycosyltransferase involved in cell wall biosynthesis
MTAGSGKSALEVALDVSAVPERPAGAGRYVLELARALAGRADCGLTLLARRDDGARWAQIAPGRRVVAVAPSRRPTRLAYEQARLGSVVAALDAPPVEVHHGPHYTMPRRSKVPCVVTVHDLTFFDHAEWHQRSKVAWFRAAMRYSVRHAAVIVCVSETTAGRLRDVLAPRCPVMVVPHGVDQARFAADEPWPGADRDVLERLGLLRPYVLHVGTLEPRKGIADLVAAFDRLVQDQAELELVLAGGAGWKAGPVMQSAAAARSRGRIRRLGYVPDADVPALLRRACAVVYPSLEEGFGLPALEALACGAPLVTTSGTSMAELAGDRALLVPPGEPFALAAAIETAISERASPGGVRRRADGIAIAASYTWAACAEGHMAAYLAAAGG